MLVMCQLSQAQFLTYPDAKKQKQEKEEPKVEDSSPGIDLDSLLKAQQAEYRRKDSIENARREAAKKRNRSRTYNNQEDTLTGIWAFPVDSSAIVTDDTINKIDTTGVKKIEGMEGINRYKPQKLWVFIVTLFLLVLIVISKYRDPKGFAASLGQVLDLRIYRQMLADSKQLYAGNNIRYFLFSTTALSLLISISLGLAGFDLLENDYRLFLLVFLGVVVVFVLKYLLHQLLADMLEMDAFGFSNIQYSILYNFFLAVVMMPVILVTYYNKAFFGTDMNILYLYGYLFFGLLIIRMLVNMVLNKSYFPFSVFYLFIYLCVLEILPLLVGIKVVLNII